MVIPAVDAVCTAWGQNYSPSKKAGLWPACWKADPWQKLEVQTINRADPTKGWPLEGPAWGRP